MEAATRTRDAPEFENLRPSDLDHRGHQRVLHSLPDLFDRRRLHRHDDHTISLAKRCRDGLSNRLHGPDELVPEGTRETLQHSHGQHHVLEVE